MLREHMRNTPTVVVSLAALALLCGIVAPTQAQDPHRINSFVAQGAWAAEAAQAFERHQGPEPPPMPGPDDGSGGGLDPHQVNGFASNLGGSMDIGDLPSFLDDPDDEPPPMPSEWDWPPLFEPGSVVPDGGGGTFGVPSWPDPTPPPDGSNFGDAYPVPEPTTLALLALGGLAILRRRR